MLAYRKRSDTYHITNITLRHTDMAIVFHISTETKHKKQQQEKKK